MNNITCIHIYMTTTCTTNTDTCTRACNGTDILHTDTYGTNTTTNSVVANHHGDYMSAYNNTNTAQHTDSHTNNTVTYTHIIPYTMVRLRIRRIRILTRLRIRKRSHWLARRITTNTIKYTIAANPKVCGGTCEYRE